MTFTEAAIEVLRREGKPLHFRKITEIAIRESLLDHVGKIPEEVMAEQLAAHCKLPKLERRVMPVQLGSFALVEWGLDEDATGLDTLVEPPPEGELPYRGRERHPMPRGEGSRASGRERAREREPARARHRDEADRHGKRYPPPAEVAYEILAGAGQPLALSDIAAQGAERLLMPDAFVRDQGSLGAALAEDNRRRESAGRSPLFRVEGDTVTLIAQPEPGERPTLVAARAPATAAELRKAALAHVRRRLRACDGPTFEHVAAQLLEKLGLREVKVAKRGREHVIYTGRRRMGLAEVRHCVRILRTGADAARRDVADLRRDIGHYGAQIGVVITAGDAARDARSDALAAGQLPILLLCGEALAEACADVGLGSVPVIVPEVDEAFFTAAAEAGAKEEAARQARREERDRREGGRREEAPRGERERPERGEAGGAEAAEPAEKRAPGEKREGGERRERPPREKHTEEIYVDAVRRDAPAPAAEQEFPTVAVTSEPELEGEEEGDEEGEGEGEGEEEVAGAEASAPGEAKAAGEGRRRRRRRRRRGGRGRREAAAAAAGGAPGATPGAEGAPAPGAPVEGGGAEPAATPGSASAPEDATPAFTAPESPPQPAAAAPEPEPAAAPAPSAVPPPLPPRSEGGGEPGEGGPSA